MALIIELSIMVCACVCMCVWVCLGVCVCVFEGDRGGGWQNLLLI